MTHGRKYSRTSTNGYLSTTAIFFWRTVHTLTLVSTSLQWPLFSVPKVAVLERFNCIKTLLQPYLAIQQIWFYYIWTTEVLFSHYLYFRSWRILKLLRERTTFLQRYSTKIWHHRSIFNVWWRHLKKGCWCIESRLKSWRVTWRHYHKAKR